jgi:sporulation protein YlmC with PRC-barrel domain
VLYRMEKLIGLSIRASDGELGKVQDVYFDDDRWTARYLVVDAGRWLEERRVLISPISVENIDWDRRSVPVRLTRQQVKASPHIDTDKPISRQHEMDVLGYYGYPNYWGGPFMWGTTSYPYPMSPTMAIPPANGVPSEHTGAPVDPHLRSAREVRSYQLHTTNASLGHVDDFLIDDESWAMRYIVVDTRDWRPGQHVVISPQWITRVNWAERFMSVDITRDTVQRAPEYDPAIAYSHVYEANLHRHYQRPGYWQ